MKPFHRIAIPLCLLLLAASCGGDKTKQKSAQAVDRKPLTPVSVSVEGTPWEDVVKIQEGLASLFEASAVTALEPEMTLLRVSEWKRENLPRFETACREAQEFFLEDQEKRLVIWTEANLRWKVAQDTIKAGVDRWNEHVARLAPPEPPLIPNEEIVEAPLEAGPIEDDVLRPWGDSKRHQLDIIIEQFTCRY